MPKRAKLKESETFTDGDDLQPKRKPRKVLLEQEIIVTADEKAQTSMAVPEPVKQRPSKQIILIDLLKRENGATIQDLMQATGWQKHSVRGVISGVLKKKLGLAILSEHSPQGRVYRIPAAE